MLINLSFSTCPNDTFIFEAMINHRVDTEGLEFEVRLADIAELNDLALTKRTDVVKVSFPVYGQLMREYTLLDAGSALGNGVGPLLVSTKPREYWPSSARIAIPGVTTTANLLLEFFAPELDNRTPIRFDKIIPAVLAGEFEAGVIIHEGRFVFSEYGLMCIQDLGAFWEEKTGLPIPLGGIIAGNWLGPELIARIDRVLRRSIAYAFANPDISKDFVKTYAQELTYEVIRQHIQLYVNDYSLSLGSLGRNAVAKLLEVQQSLNLKLA